MNPPSPVSETELLASIQAVANALAKQFAFAHYTPEDIAQQCAVFALEALPRFDPQRGKLDGYLFVHCKRRILNLRRSVLRRSDPPCRLCYEGVEHERTRSCETFEAWAERQRRKANLAKGAPADASFYDRPDGAADVATDVEESDMLRVVDLYLPVSLRADYLRLRAGQPLPRAKREAVLTAVKEILAEVIDQDEP